MFSEVLRFVFSDGPYVALTIFGMVLFLRHRTTATACIVVGFLLVILGELALSFIPVVVSSTYDSATHSAIAVASIDFRGPLARYGETVGMWIAAVGLISHIATLSKRGVT